MTDVDNIHECNKKEKKKQLTIVMAYVTWLYHEMS